ncbi:hypothetical protein J2Y46_000018 [Microbacterium sp. BE35]|uniref:Uncharacterized protein n=1 Tax=Microbacterium trichothecenolyticum TaxID=69370 RepID=A0A0M2HL81_MICTR|nr:hypothetical protein [Microbacterium sp. BE35]KJL45157.1 hypothetical protein RS82_00344 [Microbacterium trichothecenolyticum]MDR7187202.1 hypothetical protein [Microbacterium sp. BE35]
MSEKPSRWMRLKWALLGKPVSHEEYRNAHSSSYVDARVIGHAEARSHRFQAGSGF